MDCFAIPFVVISGNCGLQLVMLKKKITVRAGTFASSTDKHGIESWGALTACASHN